MENQKEGICPVCASSNLKYAEPVPIEDGIIYPVKCFNCYSSFSEVYKYRFEKQFNIKKAVF